MANAQLELAKREHAAAMARKTAKYKRDNLENTFVRKGAGMSTAAIYGTLNRLDVPPAIGEVVPWKLLVGALALVVEGTTSGKIQAAAAGVSDATSAIYLERAISEDTLIVGAAGAPPAGYIAEGVTVDAVTDGGEV